MNRITIDYREENAKQKVCKILDDWINSKKEEPLKIQVIHVISGEFEEDFDLNECTDFNGWQCDWWNNLKYHDYKFELFGEAWYGRIRISS